MDVAVPSAGSEEHRAGDVECGLAMVGDTFALTVDERGVDDAALGFDAGGPVAGVGDGVCAFCCATDCTLELGKVD